MLLFDLIVALLLNVSVPVNSIANIHVNKLQLSNPVITESGQTVWKDGKFKSQCTRTFFLSIRQSDMEQL
jgi:hypothetical protein